MKLKLDNKVIMEMSDGDIDCLEDSLLDVEKWIVGAIVGKINNCRKRMFRKWIDLLRKEGEQIPANDGVLIGKIKNHKDYKNRKDREHGANKHNNPVS